MKIIFVGLHNKPGTMPLCSSTKSGKMIDRIIKEGGFTSWQKTNLFDVEYLPQDKREQRDLAHEWFERVQPSDEDIAVLLGAFVHDHFVRLQGAKIIEVAHPASKRSHKEMNDYVSSTIQKIKSKQSNKKQ